MRTLLTCPECQQLIKYEKAYKKHIARNNCSREQRLIRERIASRKWRQNNLDKVKANRYQTRNKLRQDVLRAYGGICKCCGETAPQFLAIDHINGGGNKHRKSLHPNASAQTFYTWLRKNNYPEGFQVLCHNCNSAKAYYEGGCPHNKTFHLFVAPHSDDQDLFGSYLLQKYPATKIIVCTDGTSHQRKFGISIEQRREESRQAAKFYGLEVEFLGIAEEELTVERLMQKLSNFKPRGFVFAPALQGGNPHHDMVSEACRLLFPAVLYYSTYSKESLIPTGQIAIYPTDEQVKLKKEALACYTSQIRINKHHFDAVEGKPEYLNVEPC